MGTQNHFERKRQRWQLYLFDIFFFAVAYFGNLYLSGFFSEWEQKGADLLIQFFISLACMTAGRFVFRVYNTVLRTGNVAVFSRLIVADVISGTVYILIQRLFFADIFVYSQVFSVIGASFMISLFARVLYYYLILMAQRNTRLGRFIERCLRLLFRVDMTSDDVGAIVPFKDRISVTPDAINEVQRIIRQFTLHGRVTAITKINKGYVNRTYHISTISDVGHEHNYLLQRINTNAFKDVDALMSNFTKVADLLENGFVLPGGKPTVSAKLIKTTKDGASYYHDDSGYWRMTSFYLNVYSLDLPDNPETFYYTGIAFGSFLKKMTEIDPSEIAVVIPDFHDTYKRYLHLEEAIAQNPVNRVQTATKEIEFIRAHKDKLDLITDALRTHKLPTRICHNDCNLNNILFDCDNHKPVAVIDLDTVMPSSPLCDFGDSMRIGTNTAKDDERDLSKVSCDLTLYERYARGYLEACGDILTKEELAMLPYSSVIITLEDGIRFLADYIEGDVYYNIFYANQNLYRSRTQLKLAEDMENKLPQIKKLLQKIYDDLGFDVKLS